MRRLRILHKTEYRYKEPVEFGPHRAMLRPREGHDLHIEELVLRVEPSAVVRWIRDVYGNSVAILTFDQPATSLCITSEAVVDLFPDELADFPVSTDALRFPFQYPSQEALKTMLYRLPSYPHDGPALRSWLAITPGDTQPTLDLLEALNSRVYSSFNYLHRDEPGVQLPCETLQKGTGSCRDFAVLLMEAVRHLGFAARFVTGYILIGEGQHGATHAWTEIYIPGAGWRGYDPTNNKLVGSEHVSVGVSREQESAAPVSGTWCGPSGAFDALEVSVQVFDAKEALDSGISQ
jgi:transglutaminase-like putative cysteine protease